MRTFVLFAEEGSLQKVARRLPLTQPAVTRQIQRLEQALGAKLLDRRQKPPVLTPAGWDVLARSREILDAYERMKGVAAAPEPEGLFRLGVVNGLAHASLAERIAGILARFPRVSLRLKSGWSNELAAQHRLGHLDAAIVLSDGSRSYDAERIAEERLTVIGGHGVSSKREALERLGWVLSPEPCDARRLLASALARRNRNLTVAAEVEDPGMQLALVRNGLGLGLMPKRLFLCSPPDGIEEVKVIGSGGLSLDVLMLRSPHLGSLAKVADAVSEAMKSFVSVLRPS